MSADPFHLNRPVHLACRDVYYQKFVEYLREAVLQPGLDPSLQRVERALHFLREAQSHAEAANLSDKTSSHSRRFVRFMSGISGSLQSVVQMLEQHSRTTAKGNPIDAFLALSQAGAEVGRCHHRCATHLLEELLRILQLAEQTVDDLQRTSVAKMALADKARYEKAYRHYIALAESTEFSRNAPSV